jgi:branched-chain amino acid aminotransferase
MKAYYGVDGKIRIFRPLKNAVRINNSAERMQLPTIPTEDFVDAIKAVVEVDKDWIPTAPDTSLYIRPFIFSAQENIGVKLIHNATFMVILSPVAAYYPEGLNPVSIFVEDTLGRAATGGTGFTKCGGNYAASMLAYKQAGERGYSQVLWLDVTKTYVEEVGTMNVAFKINGTVVTPELGDTILPGVTRDSIITVLKDWGTPVEERKLPLAELEEAAKSGALEEAFGIGTAAVISPIGKLNIHGSDYTIGGGEIGELSQKLYDTLTGIQWGKLEDKYGFTDIIG